MSKTFVIADIHGGFRALKQCFERSGFDYCADTLICLGDTVDGWCHSKQCIDELLKVKNLIYVKGNHDQFVIDWYEKHDAAEVDVWTAQGGMATIASYGGSSLNIPKEHYELLKEAPVYYIDEKSRLFLHGGFIHSQPVELTDPWVLMWDRGLLKDAYGKSISDPEFRYPKYTEIYVGHTSTYFYDSKVPLNFCNLWAMDTGGGYEGKLTIMDIDTKEYWQSDKVLDLYTLEKKNKDAITFFEYYMKNGGSDLNIWC